MGGALVQDAPDREVVDREVGGSLVVLGRRPERHYTGREFERYVSAFPIG
jgi:hypothetical protein